MTRNRPDPRTYYYFCMKCGGLADARKIQKEVRKLQREIDGMDAEVRKLQKRRKRKSERADYEKRMRKLGLTASHTMENAAWNDDADLRIGMLSAQMGVTASMAQDLTECQNDRCDWWQDGQMHRLDVPADAELNRLFKMFGTNHDYRPYLGGDENIRKPL